MTDFKMVKLALIKPDPNQPRKYFDVAAMDELVDSIREKGILQPILIRPAADSEGYMIVCGERRYQASLSVNAAFKDRNEIPAVIRELSDEEALELQIIENLQRKDVHPLEEAVAFQSLLERKNNPLTLDQVAQRMGKRAAFVRQRLKLNALSKDWQAAFFAGLLELHDAMLVAMLAPKAQEEYAKEEDLASNIKNNRALELNDWRYKKYKGILSEATFDLSDKTLNPKVGPCTNCQYNSSVSLLFEEADQSPTCSNVSCFSHKTNIAFDRKLAEAKAEAGTVFISKSYYTDKDDNIVKTLSKEGYKVYNSHEYEECEQPTPPVWENWMRGHHNTPEEERKLLFEKQLASHDKKLKDFENKKASGKFLKALVVHGHRDIGKFIYITLNSKKDSDKTASKADDKLSGIIEEITRINDKEKRSKELDLEKVHSATVEELKKLQHFKKPGFSHQPIDRAIMIALLFELGGYQINGLLKTELHIKNSNTVNGQYQLDYYKQFEKITDDQIAFMVRVIALDKYGSNLASWTGGAALRLIAEYIPEVNLKALEKKQADTAAKRIARVNGKLKALEKQKEELLAEETKHALAEKSSSPKKSTKAGDSKTPAAKKTTKPSTKK
jgi:ParB/RepB/Spo0J family partition protein